MTWTRRGPVVVLSRTRLRPGVHNTKRTQRRHMASPSYSELPAEKDDDRVRPECEEQLDSCSQEGCTQILMLCMRAEAMEIAAVARMAHRRNKYQKDNTATRRAELQLHAKNSLKMREARKENRANLEKKGGGCIYVTGDKNLT